MLNYQARGRLVGAYKLESRSEPDGDLWLVCIDLSVPELAASREYLGGGIEFVVSKYVEGQREWCSGTYHSDELDAMEDFGSRVVQASAYWRELETERTENDGR